MPKTTMPLTGWNDIKSKYTCLSVNDRDYSTTPYTDLYYQKEVTNNEWGRLEVTTDLPDDIEINSAIIDFSFGFLRNDDEEILNPLVLRINGFEVTAGFTRLAVPIAIDAKSFTLTVEYLCSPILHEHPRELCYESDAFPPGYSANKQNYYTYYLHDHEVTLEFQEATLTIDYVPTGYSSDLVDYEDPEPVAGVTYVKAAHMTQLQTNANTTRKSHKMGTYAFTEILPGETWLAGWNAHVQEIRAALDEIGATHEEWLPLGANCPRVDVLTQLRRVVRHIRNQGEPPASIGTG